MEQPIYQLLYISAAKPELDAAAMLDILTQAREANQQRHITGILLYCEGSIIQLLEGEEATVKAVFSNIESDERHDSVQQLYSQTTHQRQFPDWSMGFEELPASTLNDNDIDLSELAKHKLTREQLDTVSAKLNLLMQDLQEAA